MRIESVKIKLSRSDLHSLFSIFWAAAQYADLRKGELDFRKEQYFIEKLSKLDIEIFSSRA